MFEVKGGAYTYVIIGLSFGDTILGGRQGSLKPQPLIKLSRGPRLGGPTDPILGKCLKFPIRAGLTLSCSNSKEDKYTLQIVQTIRG